MKNRQHFVLGDSLKFIFLLITVTEERLGFFNLLDIEEVNKIDDTKGMYILLLFDKKYHGCK